MIKVVQGDRQTCQSFVEDLKSRVGQASPEIEQTVRDVIEQVRAGGDSAVKAFLTFFTSEFLLSPNHTQYNFLHRYNSVVHSGHILCACHSHIGLSAAVTAGNLRNCLDNPARMGALFLRLFAASAGKSRLSICNPGQDRNAFGRHTQRPVTHVTEHFHINICKSSRNDAHAFNKL